MSQQSLGQLQSLDIRSVWSSEASDFTPWLAEADNIALLANTLELDLEVQTIEQRVGVYRADILCKDVSSGRWVLIENQLERSDHSHLGQLLTYASGLGAATIIWITRRFSDEHRAALDWLNEITDDRFSFFGVEVEVWSISGSVPAPRFLVVSSPNKWVRTMAETTKGIEAGRSESAQRRLRYWEGFLTQLNLHDKEVSVPKPNSLGNLRFSLRGRDLWITVYSASSLGRIGVFIKGRTDDYQNLLAEKAAIESEFGQELAWIESADSDTWELSARHACNPLDTDDWPNQHQWLADKLDKFLRFVKPRLASLQEE